MLLAVRKYIAKCTFPVSVPSPTVPPDIIEDNTSSDIVVKENQSIQLKCKATGYPTPIISWLREDAKPIKVHNKEQMTVEGSYLKIPHALRENSGAYLCLASNGVPPSVSRRIELLIQFPPKINVPSEVIGAALHSDVVLICMVEAAPLPLTSWHHKDKTLIFSNNKVSISVIEDSYKYQMNVKIFNLSKEDYGIYACTARNILGDAEGTIKLFVNQFVFRCENINIENVRFLSVCYDLLSYDVIKYTLASTSNFSTKVIIVIMVIKVSTRA
ncbi:Lachesin [Nymphon striatum]|nr:Lachesin [Nymphon striatum]